MGKTCSDCRLTEPACGFYISRAAKDGLSNRCKDCAKVAAKKWALENPARAQANHLAGYQRNKEKMKKASTAWGRSNPERRKAIRLKSAAKHAEKKRASGIEYHRRIALEDPERARNNYRRGAAIRRAREAGNGGYISKGDWNGLAALFETGACLYCGTYDHKLVMDHFVPVSRGGRTEVGNLLPCCRACNSSKHNRRPDDWVRAKCGDAAFGEICWFLDLTREALAAYPGIDHREV